MNNKAIITSSENFASNYNSLHNNSNGDITINATLLHDEHLKYDEKLVQVARQRLNGIADLQTAGLVVQLGSVGIMLSMYERASDMTKAAVNMDGATMGENDRVTFDEVGVPIPFFAKDWFLNIRQLEASRNRGEPLSTTQVAISTRIVADSLEDCLFNGLPDLVVDGKTIYGYTTHPDRNTVSLSGTGWANKTGRDILGDTKNMLQAAYNDNKFGSFTMYVAKDVWAELQMDYNDNKGDRTYKERIEAFSDISSVKAGDSLKSGHIAMVQMTEDVVDLAVAQDIVNVEWQTNPMQSMFKVYGAMAPRVKSDKNGSCGVVHGSV